MHPLPRHRLLRWTAGECRVSLAPSLSTSTPLHAQVFRCQAATCVGVETPAQPAASTGHGGTRGRGSEPVRGPTTRRWAAQTVPAATRSSCSVAGRDFFVRMIFTDVLFRLFATILRRLLRRHVFRVYNVDTMPQTNTKQRSLFLPAKRRIESTCACRYVKEIHTNTSSTAAFLKLLFLSSALAVVLTVCTCMNQ